MYILLMGPPVQEKARRRKNSFVITVSPRLLPVICSVRQ